MVKKTPYERMSKGERKLALGLSYGMGRSKLDKMLKDKELMDIHNSCKGMMLDSIWLDEAGAITVCSIDTSEIEARLIAHYKDIMKGVDVSGGLTPKLNPISAAQAAMMQQMQQMQQLYQGVIVNGSGQTNQAPHSGPTFRTNPEYFRAYSELTPGVTAGEITGYRAWSFNPRKSGCLKSITADMYWDYEKPMEGDVKEWGIYSFKDPYRLMEAIAPTYNGKDIIYGKIKMWGEVIEHEHGHRAQFARVHSLDYCKKSALLKMARHNYKFLELTPEEKKELDSEVEMLYGYYTVSSEEEAFYRKMYRSPWSV